MTVSSPSSFRNICVKTLGKTKPGIMAVADDYGLGASKGIQAALAKLKVSPAAVASYAPSDKDMSAQLLEIKDKGADSLILFGRPADVTLVIKQMNDLGIKLTTIGNSSIVAQTTLNNLSAAEADGGYAIGGMIPQTSTDAKIMDWSKRVQDKYKVPADNFTVSYYDTIYLLKSIIEKVGCDKAAIRDALGRHQGLEGHAHQLPGRWTRRSCAYTRHLSQQGQDAGTHRLRSKRADTDPFMGQLVVNGLALGSIYALVALGLLLIFNTVQIVTSRKANC